MNTEDILNERQKTHGDFKDHARITGRLKDVVFDEATQRINRGQNALSLRQREALDMILHKIGRIIAGNAFTADHWDDIAGYAKLCSREIEEKILKPMEIQTSEKYAKPIDLAFTHCEGCHSMVCETTGACMRKVDCPH